MFLSHTSIIRASSIRIEPCKSFNSRLPEILASVLQICIPTDSIPSNIQPASNEETSIVDNDNSPRRIPCLTSLYEEYLESQDTSTFISRITEFYTQGTLQRLAEGDTPEVRRAAVLALGFLADYDANHSLGRALHDSDRTVRIIAENSIRNIWNRAGNETQQGELNAIIRLNQSQQHEEAEQRASALIEMSPWFAEAWNQRAIARFAMRRYAESIHDSHQTLEINPYHFQAASSMGEAYNELGNAVSALESFQRALRPEPGTRRRSSPDFTALAHYRGKIKRRPVSIPTSNTLSVGLARSA